MSEQQEQEPTGKKRLTTSGQLQIRTDNPSHEIIYSGDSTDSFPDSPRSLDRKLSSNLSVHGPYSAHSSPPSNHQIINQKFRSSTVLSSPVRPTSTLAYSQRDLPRHQPVQPSPLSAHQKSATTVTPDGSTSKMAEKIRAVRSQLLFINPLAKLTKVASRSNTNESKPFNEEIAAGGRPLIQIMRFQSSLQRYHGKMIPDFAKHMLKSVFDQFSQNQLLLYSMIKMVLRYETSVAAGGLLQVILSGQPHTVPTLLAVSLASTSNQLKITADFLLDYSLTSESWILMLQSIYEYLESLGTSFTELTPDALEKVGIISQRILQHSTESIAETEWLLKINILLLAVPGSIQVHQPVEKLLRQENLDERLPNLWNQIIPKLDFLWVVAAWIRAIKNLPGQKLVRDCLPGFMKILCQKSLVLPDDIKPVQDLLAYFQRMYTVEFYSIFFSLMKTEEDLKTLMDRILLCIPPQSFWFHMIPAQRSRRLPDKAIDEQVELLVALFLPKFSGKGQYALIDAFIWSLHDLQPTHGGDKRLHSVLATVMANVRMLINEAPIEVDWEWKLRVIRFYNIMGSWKAIGLDRKAWVNTVVQWIHECGIAFQAGTNKRLDVISQCFSQLLYSALINHKSLTGRNMKMILPVVWRFLEPPLQITGVQAVAYRQALLCLIYCGTKEYQTIRYLMFNDASNKDPTVRSAFVQRTSLIVSMAPFVLYQRYIDATLKLCKQTAADFQFPSPPETFFQASSFGLAEGTIAQKDFTWIQALQDLIQKSTDYKDILETKSDVYRRKRLDRNILNCMIFGGHSASFLLIAPFNWLPHLIMDLTFDIDPEVSSISFKTWENWMVSESSWISGTMGMNKNKGTASEQRWLVRPHRILRILHQNIPSHFVYAFSNQIIGYIVEKYPIKAIENHLKRDRGFELIGCLLLLSEMIPALTSASSALFRKAKVEAYLWGYLSNEKNRNSTILKLKSENHDLTTSAHRDLILAQWLLITHWSLHQPLESPLIYKWIDKRTEKEAYVSNSIMLEEIRLLEISRMTFLASAFPWTRPPSISSHMSHLALSLNTRDKMLFLLGIQILLTECTRWGFQLKRGAYVGLIESLLRHYTQQTTHDLKSSHYSSFISQSNNNLTVTFRSPWQEFLRQSIQEICRSFYQKHGDIFVLQAIQAALPYVSFQKRNSFLKEFMQLLREACQRSNMVVSPTLTNQSFLGGAVNLKDDPKALEDLNFHSLTLSNTYFRPYEKDWWISLVCIGVRWRPNSIRSVQLVQFFTHCLTMWDLNSSQTGKPKTGQTIPGKTDVKNESCRLLLDAGEFLMSTLRSNSVEHAVALAQLGLNLYKISDSFCMNTRCQRILVENLKKIIAHGSTLWFPTKPELNLILSRLQSPLQLQLQKVMVIV